METNRKEKMAALERRLREIDQQKAAIARQLERTETWLGSADVRDEAKMLLRTPKLREAALPPGREAPEVEERTSTEDASRIVSADLGPADAEMQAVTPQLRIRRTETLQPYAGMQVGSPLPRRGEPLKSYGVLGELQRGDRRRKGEGSPKAKAIFMTLMVLVLAYILFRMMT